MPCTCGSMMSGQRLHAETMAPFSTEMRSAGRPFEIILAVSASVMSTSIGSTPSVIGTFCSPRSSSQLPDHSARRLSLSNAPTYETKPAASMQSPTSETDEPLSFSISLPQRSFSEDEAADEPLGEAEAFHARGGLGLDARLFLGRVLQLVLELLQHLLDNGDLALRGRERRVRRGLGRLGRLKRVHQRLDLDVDPVEAVDVDDPRREIGRGRRTFVVHVLDRELGVVGEDLDPLDLVL